MADLQIPNARVRWLKDVYGHDAGTESDIPLPVAKRLKVQGILEIIGRGDA